MALPPNGVVVRIDHELSFDLRSVSAEALYEIKTQFRYKNPAFQKARSMGYAPVNEPRFYDVFEENRREMKMKLWRGTAKRLKEILTEHGHKVFWQDKRLVLPETGLDLGTLKLFEYQEPAAQALIDDNQGVLRGHTGSGKTETLLAAAVMSQQPTLVEVWNKDLLKQWVERIVKYGILKEHQIGIIQGPKTKIGPITIGMIQTLHKRVDKVRDKFGCVIVDECQRTPATTFVKSVTPFPAKYRWGGSADEKRKDGKHFLLYEAIGYQEWSIRGDKVSFDPVYEIEGQGQSLTPTLIIVPTEYADEEYEENRNYGQLLNRLVADEKRNKVIAKLLRKQLEKGRQVILFTERVDSAVYWAHVVSSWGHEATPLIGGAEHAAETSAGLQRLRSGQCRFAATTTYADVGLDVPSLDTAFLTCPGTKNLKRMNQQIGRIVRPMDGKPEPVAFYFWDREVSGISKGIKSLKAKWTKNVTLEQV